MLSSADRVTSIASLLLALAISPACGKSEQAPAPAAPPVAADPGSADASPPTPPEPAGGPAVAAPSANDDEPAAIDAPPAPAANGGDAEPGGDDEAAAALPSGFTRYTHEQGRFAVDAPGEPEFSDTTSETALGTLTYTNAVFRVADGALMIAWGDLPIETDDDDDDVVDAMFDGGRDAMLKGVGGKLLSEEIVTLDGRPGRAWLIAIEGPPELGTIINHARSYLDGTRNYILQGMRLATGDPERAEHFVSSFRFTAPAPDAEADAEPEPEPAPAP